MDDLFVKGLLVGFCLAAPVGPIAVLCVQRTMSHGKLAGFVSGLGAAAADAFYGTLAAFGVTVISAFLLDHRMLFQRAGGAILSVLGLRLLFARPPRRQSENDGRSLSADFFSTFVLTLTNPMTFIAFAAIFATLGVGVVWGHSILTAELVGGVFAGSGLWFAVLVALANLFRDRFRYRILVAINRVAGVFVIGVGVLYLFVLRKEPRVNPELLLHPIEALEGRLPTPSPTVPLPAER
ncbi:MAG: LysE family translocator [Thermoanaerobaculia bacterium]